MSKKRHRKTLPPIDPDKKKLKKPVANGSMLAPNHNIPLDLSDLASSCDDDTLGTQRFPMLHLTRSEEGSGDAKGLAFVDPIYGLRKWVDRDIAAPPTWMDPEIFIRMVVQDEEVQSICRQYYKAGTPGKRVNLKQRLDAIFEQIYLVYMFEQYRKVRGLVAQWTTAHFEMVFADEAPRKKKQKKATVDES